MVDLDQVKGQKIYWPLKEIVQELELLRSEVEELKQRKKPGRPPKNERLQKNSMAS